ncbi:hypothetical protein [Streptomyces sp. ODS05-4]|uniref:hypothetical protein n=1 Tax=Streptomyces sp. ODS05-4 TaxID=2944939 RepID=UPI00210D0EA0|nr:hypothetical protein [Streptomyces sp. ODS05-4]
MIRLPLARSPRGAGCLRCASDGLQTGVAHVPHLHHAQGERNTMNIVTDLLAGFFHFLGWLV